MALPTDLTHLNTHKARFALAIQAIFAKEKPTYKRGVYKVSIDLFTSSVFINNENRLQISLDTVVNGNPKKIKQFMDRLNPARYPERAAAIDSLGKYTLLVIVK